MVERDSSWDDKKILIENCINKAFKEQVPLIMDECRRQARDVTQTCNAHNEFRRETDIDAYREMKANYSKLRRKEIIVFGISITAINAAILLFLKKII